MTSKPIHAAAGRKLPFTRVLLAAVVAIVLSVLVNLLIRWLGMLFVPVDPEFIPLLTWQPTAVMTTLFLSVATIVFLLINAFSANPPRIFNIVALVALIISLIPNVMMLFSSEPLPNIGIPTPGAAIILMLQHVAAYLITVWSFTSWAFTRWAPQA